jgi:hypothetical protein
MGVSNDNQQESSSDVGEIIKVMRGLPTLRNASEKREDGLLEFLNSSEFVYAHSTCRQKYIHNKYLCMYFQIQCGNFEWNKIHNLDVGSFCKKSQNRSIFVFLCPHFGV